MLTDPGALWVGLWLLLAVLEVCQFSRDASVAEAWLIAQEPYLASRDFGHTVDSVEKLIKRHEAFEKSTASWAERFAALEKPTTVSGGRLGEREGHSYWDGLLQGTLSKRSCTWAGVRG